MFRELDTVVERFYEKTDEFVKSQKSKKIEVTDQSNARNVDVYVRVTTPRGNHIWAESKKLQTLRHGLGLPI